MITIPQRIKQLEIRYGGASECCRYYGIDKGYWSRLAKGEKFTPGEAILKKLGLFRVITYSLTEE